MDLPSNKPLAEKLGYKPTQNIQIISAPENYELKNSGSKPFDLIQFFTKSKRELEKEFPVLKDQLVKTGSLWISWPKKSSKVKSDLDENVVMRTGLESGLVDIKVISVDEIWSGLKFVFRIKDR